MNASDITTVLGVVKTIWPNTRWEAAAPVVARIWFAQVGDLPLDATEAVLLEFDTRGERFAPSPGTLRRAVLDHLEPDTTPGLDEAWLEVRDGIRRWGWCSKAAQRHWSHPSVEAAVTAFGWQELCESENPVADRAHFARYYEAASRRNRPSRSTPAVAATLAAYLPDALGSLTKELPA